MTDDSTSANDFADVDPSRLLDRLTEQGTQISRKEVGDRTVFVLRVPADVLGSSGTPAGAKATVSVSVDSADRVRTLTMDATPGDPGSQVSMTIGFDDFGVPVDVRPPPAGDVGEIADLSKTFEESSPGSFSGSIGGSAADKKRACDAFRAATKKQPTPTNEQQRQAYEQFRKLEQQVCAG
jgi:hypothetical protein